MEISGTIQSGVGKGAFFTQVDWVVDQCEKLLGYIPFPGTLNIHVIEEDVESLTSLFQKTDFNLIPPGPEFCAAQGRVVNVGGIPGAVILPGEEVRIHGFDVLEVISSCHLKRALGLSDGDTVTVSWDSTSENLIREVYDFASSAGAFEGYLYQNQKVSAEELTDWIHNLTEQYGRLPGEAIRQIQPALNRTLGRAVHSLAAHFGGNHPHSVAINQLIQGPIPDSYKDFEDEKEDKNRKFGRK